MSKVQGAWAGAREWVEGMYVGQRATIQRRKHEAGWAAHFTSHWAHAPDSLLYMNFLSSLCLHPPSSSYKHHSSPSPPSSTYKSKTVPRSPPTHSSKTKLDV